MSREPEALAAETLEELVDVCAWSYILSRRVQALRDRLEPGTAHGDRRPLLTAEHAARLLALPKARLYALARKGALPGVVRVGSSLRFEAEALERWIAGGGDGGRLA